MNIIGAIIVSLFGILFWKISCHRSTHPISGYEHYPKVLATVLGTIGPDGDRWIVEFENENGELVLGESDTFAVSTFHPEKWHLPKRNTKEMVYYWLRNRPNSRISINGKPVLYRIHFCDDALYDLERKSDSQSRRWLRVISIAIFILAAIVLFFGYR